MSNNKHTPNTKKTAIRAEKPYKDTLTSLSINLTDKNLLSVIAELADCALIVTEPAQRDADSTGVAGISATKVRQALKDGDLEEAGKMMGVKDMKLLARLSKTIKKYLK